nr:MAG: rep protein [Cressdnaviricota sp.]
MSRMARITQWILEVQAESDQKPIDGDLKEKNIWVWGPPGTGKSRWAHQLPGTKYMKLSNKWWDGYNGQPIVIMEDLDLQLAQHLKLWADRYVFTAEVKGGHRPIRPDFNLVVTSNYHPDSCFTNPEDAAAIRRRFTICHVAMEGAEPQWVPIRVEEVGR